MGNVYYKIQGYNDGSDVLPENAFRISPSGVEKFFSDKRTWYGENLMGEDKKFTGSTSTELGTIVHHVAEVVANCKITGEQYNSELLHTEVGAYIDALDTNIYDVSLISSLWKDMGELLVKEYVLNDNIIHTEPFVFHELVDGIFPSGSIDAITSTAPTDTWEDVIEGKNAGSITVRDYKTAGTKPSSFNWGYTLQAYTYAWLLHKQFDIKVDNVELCFVVRPTKTLPCRTFKFTKPFDSKAYDMIEGILKLVSESVQCYKDWPDMEYLLAGDFRLKKSDIPRS